MAKTEKIQKPETVQIVLTQYTITDASWGFIDLGLATNEYVVVGAFTPFESNVSVRLSNIERGNWRAQLVDALTNSTITSGSYYIMLYYVNR